MALHTISNNCLVVTISDLGAELQSIKSSDGKEYLWQGDAEFWGRRSPILFPFVGAEVNDTYRYDGKSYHMPQHGFARDEEFTFVEKEGSRIVFSLESSEKTRENYPFDFLLTVEYSLLNNELHVKWTVANRTEGVMYYAIGAHPAFNLPEDLPREDCYIMLDKIPQKLTTISGRYAAEEVSTKNTLHITPNRMIRLEHDLFKNDALVFENSQ
ncbi:MAG: aldose 1-epimerase family protein, partial [Clostridia bacterium]|nr:aldose 1-epimerase family protein [Clostridia bacterium]